MSGIALVWFRRDLRLYDHTALRAAVDQGERVLPVFIFDPALLNSRYASPARLAFLLAGLQALDADLRALGSRLIVRTGEPLAVLHGLAEAAGVGSLHFNRDYSPFAQARDQRVIDGFTRPVFAHHDALIHPPGVVAKKDGSLYRVFRPYFNLWTALPAPTPDTRTLRKDDFAATSDLASEPLLNSANWSGPLPEAGERAALRLLDTFAAGAIFDYAERRNRLSEPAWVDEAAGTSSLSPYLRFGMVSARHALAVAQAAAADAPDEQARRSVKVWMGELAWRDYYGAIMAVHPEVLSAGYKPTPAGFAWRVAPQELARWQAGETGYPVVDAAMRQMAAFGWMHNRARMIVATFLSKDLLLDWREGEAHFMRSLLDGDPAANNGGWQWAAGTGTDAQPFFRVFNPVLQSQRYDPAGDYIRRWIPELRNVPDKFIHEPWAMPVPPLGYPAPVVQHGWARDRALTAWKRGRAGR